MTGQWRDRARAFEHLFDAVVVTNSEGIIVDWNRGAVALYGYEAAEVLGQPVSILHAPEDVERITSEVFAGIARDGFWTGEVKRRGRDGKLGWIESLVVPLRDDAGAPVGALGINRDITRRKEAEEELRRAAAQWRSLLECLPDGVLICDQDGIIVMVNARAEALFDYRRDELIGQSIERLVPVDKRELHAQHRGEFLGSARPRPMRDGQVLQARRRDGSFSPVEIGLSAIDTVSGPWVIAIVHDCAGREALTEQLRLLGEALAAAANGIAISDAHGVCQWINPGFTAITGYAPVEIIGSRFSVLSSGVHDKAFFQHLWATISSGQPWHGEITNRHRAGHNYVEEQTIAPVRDRHGAITHYVAVKQDITERRQMQEQLQAANATLTRQLAEIEALQGQLQEQSIRDPLTGLYNRRYLSDTLERELARAARAVEPVAVAIIDLDHFKSVNDTHGHRGGDRVLQVLGELLRSSTRRSDIACRYGGEEFMIVMPGATLEVAVARAEALRARVADNDVVHEGQRIRVTLSIGVAVFPTHAAGGDALLQAADEALYVAKGAGRNRVVAHGSARTSSAVTPSA